MDDSDGRGDPVGWFELDDAEWYELEQEAAAALTTEADEVFLRVLRQCAETSRWSCDPEDTHARHFREQGRGKLRLRLTLSDDESSILLMTFALVFDGARIVGEEAHSQAYDFMAGTVARLEGSGGPARLAEQAADWFETLLDWPIERRIWGSPRNPYFEEWVLLPYDRPICGVPAGGERCLSHTRGGRPATPPDKVVPVRGRHPV